MEVHDASGLLVMPGAVDVHTHLDWEFGTARTVDTFGTGTMAAAFGGTTSVIDFANQSHGQSPLEGLADWHERCASRCVDVGAHMIILDPFPQALADLRTLARDEGVTSFKLFMAYPNVLMVDDGVCFYVMREAAKHGAVVCVHAENGYAINVLVQEAVAAGNTAPKYHYLTRPPELEGEATARAITLAEYAGAPLYVVHVTCKEALHAIAAGARPLRSGPRRDLHAVPVPHACGAGAAGLRGREVRVHAAFALARSTRRRSGAGCGGAICRRCRPTTARSATRSSPTG